MYGMDQTCAFVISIIQFLATPPQIAARADVSFMLANVDERKYLIVVHLDQHVCYSKTAVVIKSLEVGSIMHE